MRWRTAIFAIFFASGLSIATWASRMPEIKAGLGIDNAQVGLLLLAGGAASILGVWLAAVVLARFGARRGMLAAMLVFAAGIALIGVGTDAAADSVVVVIGLVLWGFGNGNVDVMMNVEGSAIEKHAGRTILPLFHAFFSLGTVAGAGAGVAAIAWGADVAAHALVIAAAIAVIAVAAFANVPNRPAASVPAAGPATAAGGHSAPAQASGARGWRARLALAMSAWREPRTYALGVVMLGMAFAEGGANDWLPLAVVEGHHSTEEMGAIALTVFSVSMALGRIVGGPVVDRVGRVAVLRILAATAATGLLLFILAPNLPVLFIGAALWGLGASLGFPLGMSAAADDPEHAASRVAAAATIGYVAFLVGPPVLGFISEQIGLLPTLGIIVVLIVASGLFSSAARPLSTSHVGGHT